MTATYAEMIRAARGLIENDGTDNPEYARGIVELIADAFGVPGVYLADRKQCVAADLGVSGSVL